MVKKYSIEESVFELGPRVVFDALILGSDVAIKQLIRAISLSLAIIRSDVRKTLIALVNSRGESERAREADESFGIRVEIYQKLISLFDSPDSGVVNDDIIALRNQLHIAFQLGVMGLKIFIDPRLSFEEQIIELQKSFVIGGKIDEVAYKHLLNLTRHRLLTETKK